MQVAGVLGHKSPQNTEEGETMVMAVGCLLSGKSSDQRLNPCQLSGDGARKARFMIYMEMIHLVTVTGLQLQLHARQMLYFPK